MAKGPGSVRVRDGEGKGGPFRRPSLAERFRRRGGSGEDGSLRRVVELALAFLVPLALLFTSIPTGFMLEGPGPSFDLQAELGVEGAETYSSRGEFLLTSVSLRESNLVCQLLSLARHDLRLIEARRFLGEELDMEAQDRMDGILTVLSQETAAVLALRGAGMEVEVKELGALVLDVVKGSPAQGKLHAGQVIVGVDGVPVQGSADLGDRIAAVPEGEEVILGVREIDWKTLASSLEEGERPDLERLMGAEMVEVPVLPAWDPDLGRRVIGVYTRDYFTYGSPVEVTWKMNSVRGPSAGLMMTLSLLNLLLPEDLTRGRKVAGTGEVFLDGKVGAIGGLPMKIRAAEARGAEVFLYPRQNQDDLAGVETRMRLIPVDSLQEALQALSQNVD